MRLLLTDETNRRPGAKVRFFVYGGLILRAEDLSALDDAVAGIRRDAGYMAPDEFKFDTRSRPPQVTREAATRAKRRVLKTLKELRARFIAYVALHDIIKNTDPDQQLLWAANTVISQFNKYLREVAHDDGLCVVDNLPVKRSWQYLSEKFTTGLEIDGKQVPVDRIKMFAATCNNASHASSAMDIVLGTFRYCINEPSNRKAAAEMMADVVDLMWHERAGEDIHALDRGLVLRPVLANITTEYFRNQYLKLIEHINGLLEAGG